MPELVKDIEAAGYRLAADLSKTSGSEIIVEGLVGMDVMQFLKPIQQINCMRGTAWKISSRVMPVGSVDHFLNMPPPSSASSYKHPECSFSVVLTEKTFVNFVLHPKETYADPLESIFEDIWVERKVDGLFSVDSLGISEDALSDYDQSKIKTFKDSNLFHLLNSKAKLLKH